MNGAELNFPREIENDDALSYFLVKRSKRRRFRDMVSKMRSAVEFLFWIIVAACLIQSMLLSAYYTYIYFKTPVQKHWVDDWKNYNEIPEIVNVDSNEPVQESWKNYFEIPEVDSNKSVLEDRTNSTEILEIVNVCEPIPNEQKFDCYPRGSPRQDDCESRGCCWQPVNKNKSSSDEINYTGIHVPWCFYPKNFTSYKVISRIKFSRGERILLNLTRSSEYSVDVKTIKMDINFETSTRLRIKITDNDATRYEPPYPEVPVFSSFKNDDFVYDVVVDERKFGFAIIRKDSGKVIFDTRGVGGFVFSDQFLQISALMPSKYIYGLGERRNNFLLDVNWQEITLFNRGGAPKDDTNLYGTHPFYLAVEQGGLSHGVFLLNSNAMEIILQPAPAITYRTIGGVFDFHFFLGPTPAYVIRQYHEVIGYPFLPPYWSLGFHLCRFGLKTLNDTMNFLSRNREIGLPFDGLWNDIDYMNNRNDFTIKQEFSQLQDFVINLHKLGMKYVVILDPGVASREPAGSYPPYDDGFEMDIFVMNSSSLPMEGIVWNKMGGTVFTDFTDPKAAVYWLRMITELYKKVPFDGLWLDMNEISNFVDGSLEGCGDPVNNTLDNPPYVPNVDGGHLNYRTLCMSAKQYVSSHYDVHNIYGFAESITTNFALATIRKKRPFLLSRSTFAGSGKFTAHWTGDVFSTWDDMKHSVGDIMSFSMFGIPMVGADICGFNGNTTEQLCQRWSQLGAFYPFSRNHNSDDAVDQDPAVFSKAMINSTKKALKMRYKLLPYLYTLLQNANRNGESVLRPLFFEFPDDPQTYTQNTQFLWGPGLLIVPVLKENATSVTSYFPKTTWFDAFTLEMHESRGDYVIISAPLDHIPVYYRAGFIIPFQEPGLTTEESRKNPFGLYVALDDNVQAQGSLYWDDGETYLADLFYNLIYFSSSNGTIKGYPEVYSYKTTMILQTIHIMGVSGDAETVLINNQTHTNFQFSREKKVLSIKEAYISLGSYFTIKWF